MPGLGRWWRTLGLGQCAGCITEHCAQRLRRPSPVLALTPRRCWSTTAQVELVGDDYGSLGRRPLPWPPPARGGESLALALALALSPFLSQSVRVLLPLLPPPPPCPDRRPPPRRRARRTFGLDLVGGVAQPAVSTRVTGAPPRRRGFPAYALMPRGCGAVATSRSATRSISDDLPTFGGPVIANTSPSRSRSPRRLSFRCDATSRRSASSSTRTRASTSGGRSSSGKSISASCWASSRRRRSDQPR